VFHLSKLKADGFGSKLKIRAMNALPRAAKAITSSQSKSAARHEAKPGSRRQTKVTFVE
jgi:hypothetical protein